MAIKVFKSNTLAAPIGVSDTSGYRTAIALESQASKQTTEFLGQITNYASNALTLQRTNEAQSDAAKHAVEYDAKGNPAVPTDMPSEMTVYGAEFRKQILNKYANQIDNDSSIAMADFASQYTLGKENADGTRGKSFDAKGFQAASQSYIQGVLESVDPRIVPSVAKTLQKRQQGHFQHILGLYTSNEQQLQKKEHAVVLDRQTNEYHTSIQRFGSDSPQAQDAMKEVIRTANNAPYSSPELRNMAVHNIKSEGAALSLVDGFRNLDKAGRKEFTESLMTRSGKMYDKKYDIITEDSMTNLMPRLRALDTARTALEVEIEEGGKDVLDLMVIDGLLDANQEFAGVYMQMNSTGAPVANILSRLQTMIGMEKGIQSEDRATNRRLSQMNYFGLLTDDLVGWINENKDMIDDKTYESIKAAANSDELQAPELSRYLGGLVQDAKSGLNKIMAKNRKMQSTNLAVATGVPIDPSAGNAATADLYIASNRQLEGIDFVENIAAARPYMRLIGLPTGPLTVLNAGLNSGNPADVSTALTLYRNLIKGDLAMEGHASVQMAPNAHAMLTALDDLAGEGDVGAELITKVRSQIADGAKISDKGNREIFAGEKSTPKEQNDLFRSTFNGFLGARSGQPDGIIAGWRRMTIGGKLGVNGNQFDYAAIPDDFITKTRARFFSRLGAYQGLDKDKNIKNAMDWAVDQTKAVEGYGFSAISVSQTAGQGETHALVQHSPEETYKVNGKPQWAENFAEDYIRKNLDADTLKSLKADISAVGKEGDVRLGFNMRLSPIVRADGSVIYEVVSVDGSGGAAIRVFNNKPKNSAEFKPLTISFDDAHRQARKKDSVAKAENKLKTFGDTFARVNQQISLDELKAQ